MIDNISRKTFLSVLAAIPAVSITAPQPSNALHLDVDVDFKVRSMIDADYIEEINNSCDGWVTWAGIESGETAVVNEFGYLSCLDDLLDSRAVGHLTVILVFVGGTIAGKLIAKVIEDRIVEVTGADLTTWGQIAARKIMNQPVPAGNAVYLSCDIYPPHSGEYHRCMGS